MRQFFKHEDYEFMFLLVLGATYHRGADVGESLATAQRIKDGDGESWFREWMATADRVREIGERSRDRDHRVSARLAFLRAATYYDAAKDPERFLPTWESHRAAWDAAADLFDPPLERMRIPYEDTALDGYFFSVDGSGERRPLLILNNGSDGPVSAMWLQGAASGLDRGYNCLAFDGPGQGTALWRQNIPFRHDWEHVITPVVDSMRTRSASTRIASRCWG